MTTGPVTTGPVTFATRADEDAWWMGQALAEAERAATVGEVPVGAVLVHNGAVVARGSNAMVGGRDATQHAEMRVLRAAAYAVGIPATMLPRVGGNAYLAPWNRNSLNAGIRMRGRFSSKNSRRAASARFSAPCTSDIESPENAASSG